MGETLNITYTASLANLCELNPSFDSGILRICYPGENANKSFLSKEVLEQALPTIYNCPIVCNYNREIDTLGDHDMEIVRNSDNNLRLINVTTPVGVIPESARVWFEDYEEKDGSVHNYLYAEVLLWKRQEAYEKIKKNGVTSHSMEIEVEDGEMINGIYHINKFIFKAFCLIGSTPCFESSALELFSQNWLKNQIFEMMQDLKRTYEEIGFHRKDNNICSRNYSTKGGKKTLNEKINLIAKYGIDVNALDFSIEDFTVEELTEKFEIMKHKSEANKLDSKFSLESNIMEEIAANLRTQTVLGEYGEERRYCYADHDTEKKEVYCWDLEDGLLYGFSFSMDGDSIQIDFASKKRKKYTIVDFDGDEQKSLITILLEEMENKLKDYAEIKLKFDTVSGTIASMEVELERLRKFKADADKATELTKREEVFTRFEDLNGIEAFDTLKDNCMKYSLETLEEKCYAIRGKNNTTLNFSLKSKIPKLKVSKTDIQNEPYGGLFLKYAKGSSK